MLGNWNKCTGCGSCFNICPKYSITMTEDNEGFNYPVVDTDKCVECKLCEQVCPLLNPVNKSEKSEAYAAINLKDNIRQFSSSGGVFLELANIVVQQGGYVCGASFNDNFRIAHRLSRKESDIYKMCGAKYVQSDAWKCFKKIKGKLEAELPVLFVGTPCQVAGLKQFLRKDYEFLVTVDMICHGVPSPMIWAHYIKERNKMDAPDSSISKIELRSKESGWSRYKYSVKFTYQNDKCYCVEQCNDRYMRGFVENLYLRPSCAECKFKGIERCSDITLGDYWGIWDQNPEFDDNKGTSLVFIHTAKGNQLWENVSLNFKSIQVNVEEAVKQNPSALNNSIPHKNRNRFFKEYSGEDSLIKQIETQLEIAGENKNQSILSRVAKKLFEWRK